MIETFCRKDLPFSATSIRIRAIAGRLPSAAYVVAAFCLVATSPVIGQELLGYEMERSADVCHDLSLRAGEAAKVDCVLQEGPGLVFEWISPDAASLAYLENLSDASPRFRAPSGLLQARRFTYYRIARDAAGGATRRTRLEVVVSPDYTVDCRLPGGSPLKGEARRWCEEADNAHGQVPEDSWPAVGGAEETPVLAKERPLEDTAVLLEAPLVSCVHSITVEESAETLLSCTGISPSGDLLQYTAEFDWPPYTETMILPAGAFDYVLKAPAITDAADIRTIELSALDLETGLSASHAVEVHVIDADPVLECDDLVVREGEHVEIPCSATAAGRFQYQFIPQVRLGDMPWGLYDRIPSFVAPEVSRDTSFAVVVRVLEPEARRVVQRTLTMVVQDADGIDFGMPMNLTIECNPSVVEVYESEPEISIECTVTSGQDGDFVWTWAAEGQTPLEFLLPDFNVNTPRFADFQTPESVEEDAHFEYSVTASHDELGASNRASIFISVLERPDITVACEDMRARVADPPLELSCIATNEKNVARTYLWDWEGPIELLIGDLANTGMPSFEVPTEQEELFQDYVYTVSASAELADPPEVRETLTITVEKILGTLTLSCATPIEVYEGAADVALECMVAPVDPGVGLVWSWQPQGGVEDRLIAGPDNFSAPIFQVPGAVPADQTYEYAISISAPNYISSEPQFVSIVVLRKPTLALDCESEVTVSVGDPPRRLHCEVTNDKGLALDYLWQWDPGVRLTQRDTATPLFDVPREQRAESRSYPYRVSVTADNAIAAVGMVEVNVVNPDAVSPFQVMVSTTALDFGTLGPSGLARLDPTTEQISGLTYGGAAHAGRLVVTAQDSVSVSLEFTGPALLHYTDERGVRHASRSLSLAPTWSYSESCVTLAPEVLKSSYVRAQMGEGDCRLLRFGGEVALEAAEPGTYTGEIPVVLSLRSLEETYFIPVTLALQQERRVVTLGLDGARFGPATVDSGGLERDQSLSIYPSVAVLEAGDTEGIFEISNPSVVPLEVTVATEFGYSEAQVPPAGRFTAAGVSVTDLEESVLGDLSDKISVHPALLLLAPGQTKQVRYALREGEQARMGDRGYAAFLTFTAEPRHYLRVDQLPESVRTARTARISTRVHGVYIPGDGPGVLSAALESVQDGPGQRPSVTLLIATRDHPFAGQVAIRSQGGEELGRSEILVYTRSRVRVPLRAAPGRTVTVHFIPRGNAQTPPPVRLSVSLP